MVESSSPNNFVKSNTIENFIGLGIGTCAKLSYGLRNSDQSNLMIES